MRLQPNTKGDPSYPVNDRGIYRVIVAQDQKYARRPRGTSDLRRRRHRRRLIMDIAGLGSNEA